MMPDSRPAQATAAIRMPPFHRRLWQALRTWSSRWLFWGLLLFAAVQHVSMLGWDDSSPDVNPTVAPSLSETSYVRRGDRFQRKEIAPGEAIPGDTTYLQLGKLTGSKELREAAELPGLSSLSLSTMNVSAEDIQLLKNAKELESLWLNGLPFTPDVSELQNLETLGLHGMQFADVPAGTNPLEQLKKLQRLETLSVSNSNIRSEWLESLRDLPRLRLLRVGNTPVGDEAVSLLIDLKQLKELRVSHARFTRSGWDRLISSRPDLSMKLEDVERMESGFVRGEQRRAGFLQSIVMAFCFPAFILGMVISTQLKTQFASPRARMMPGFAAPHLMIAALVSALVLGPSALIVWLKIGLSPVGPLALGLLVTVMFAWQSWLMTNTLTLPLLVVWFSLMFGAQTEFIGGILGRWFLTPDTTGVALAVLGGSVASLIYLALRVVSVHEECPEYGMAIPADGFRAFTSRAANRDFEKMAGRLIAQSRFTPWALDRWFQAIMKRLPLQGGLRRVALYHVVHGYGMLIVLPVLCLGFSLFSAMMARNGIGESIAVFFPVLFLPHFVIAGIGTVWLQHSKWHAAELLRPQSRQEFVRGVFQGVGSDLVYAGAWILGSQAIAWSQGVAAFGRTPSETALVAVTFTTGYIMIAASTLLVVLSYRNFWVYMAVMTVLFVLLGGLCAGFVALELDRTPFGIPVYLILCFVMGMTVLKRARSRWMSLEMV